MLEVVRSAAKNLWSHNLWRGNSKYVEWVLMITVLLFILWLQGSSKGQLRRNNWLVNLRKTKNIFFKKIISTAKRWKNIESQQLYFFVAWSKYFEVGLLPPWVAATMESWRKKRSTHKYLLTETEFLIQYHDISKKM